VDAARTWSDAEGVHIDVRGLPPPQPLVQIMTLVRSVDESVHVIVHHDRDPRLLYAELAEIGWTAERVAADPGEVRLRLARLP
jgi:hypothetical protein